MLKTKMCTSGMLANEGYAQGRACYGTLLPRITGMTSGFTQTSSFHQCGKAALSS